MTRIIFPILLFFIPCFLSAQIFPKEGSNLNYRIIGFSIPDENEKASCMLEIAQGNFSDISSFKKNIIESVACKNGKTIAEVPLWGSDYSWRMVSGKNKKANGEFHHFHTLTNGNIDTSRFRLRIIQKAEQYKDAYVFVDQNQALYDMNGAPVWFLPSIIDTANGKTTIRDMKLTPQGSITVTIVDGSIYDINYDGLVLWKGPDTGKVSGDSIEHYHHEFTQLNNGHYMVLGSQRVSWEVPDYRADSSRGLTESGIELDSDNKYYQKLVFGTIIEYNKKGNVVWSWKSSDYFKNSDLKDIKWRDGRFGMGDTHENSFYFDEENGYVYVSFRNISRILKVKYPEGTVAAVYGTIYRPGVTELGNGIFCGQHSIKRSKDGNLYVYNNNSLRDDTLPKIEIMQEPVTNDDTLKKIWEYQCTLDGLNDSEKMVYNNKIRQRKRRPNVKKSILTELRNKFTAGGNVMELPDQSIFVSSCGPFSKIFIVNKDKKILWSSVFENRNIEARNWAEISTYRASILPDRKALEQLIWNAEVPHPASPEGR